jgi:hypothetical protein
MIKLITAPLLLKYSITETVIKVDSLFIRSHSQHKTILHERGNKQIQRENRKATKSTWINIMLYSQCISELMHLRRTDIFFLIFLYIYKGFLPHSNSGNYKFKYNIPFYYYLVPLQIFVMIWID